MKHFALLSLSTAALMLSACGETQDAAPADADAPATAGTEPAGPAADDAAAPAGEDWEAGLSALDQAAQAACEAQDDAALLAALPEGASFSSRGPDGIVVIACKLEGRSDVFRFDAPELPEDFRMDFDFTVAEHMRHGMRPGDDRSATGAFRMRDGRFCSVQTDETVSATVCEAAREAEAVRAGQE